MSDNVIRSEPSENDILRDDILKAIIDCRHRVMRGTVNNREVLDILQECLHVMADTLGHSSAVNMYPGITEPEQIHIEEIRAMNRAIDQTAAHVWLIVAAKLNAMLKDQGWTFHPSEFMLAS